MNNDIGCASVMSSVQSVEREVIHSRSFMHLPWADTILGAETITLRSGRHKSWPTCNLLSDRKTGIN